MIKSWKKLEEKAESDQLKVRLTRIGLMLSTRCKILDERFFESQISNTYIYRVRLGSHEFLLMQAYSYVKLFYLWFHLY